MSAEKTCPLHPADLMRRFREAAAARGFREEKFATIDDVRLSAFTRRAPGTKPRIYLSAGIHGDEPASPEALLHLLTHGAFDDRATWFLVPLLNPTGLRQEQRENADGVDLNRDYRSLDSAEIRGHVKWLQNQPRFDLAICLHEDWEATGYYLYELARNPDPQFGDAVRNAAGGHLPIEPGAKIDGRSVDETGIIRPESDPFQRATWPEAIYLFKYHTDLCFTFESPTGRELDLRMQAHAATVKATLAVLFRSIMS